MFSTIRHNNGKYFDLGFKVSETFSEYWGDKQSKCYSKQLFYSAIKA